MPKLNLFLVMILLGCYSGFGARASYSSDRSNNSSCHSVEKQHHTQNRPNSGATAQYFNEDVKDHKAFRCCFESLPNAPQNDHTTLKDLTLDDLFVNNLGLETNNLGNSSSHLGVREHDPPDLYVSNASLLL